MVSCNWCNKRVLDTRMHVKKDEEWIFTCDECDRKLNALHVKKIVITPILMSEGDGNN